MFFSIEINTFNAWDIDENILKNINNSSRIDTMTCRFLDALYITDELMNCSRIRKKKIKEQRKTSIQDHKKYKAKVLT